MKVTWSVLHRRRYCIREDQGEAPSLFPELDNLRGTKIAVDRSNSHPGPLSVEWS